MKGSVIRALIELITNCDDAYSRSRKSGPISIEVHRFPGTDEPTQIAVRDRATGLNRGEMEKNFIQLGGDRSGFADGEEVRGLFSRGSKDTAWFGETVFEGIKGGEYTVLPCSPMALAKLSRLSPRLIISRGLQYRRVTMVFRQRWLFDEKTPVFQTSENCVIGLPLMFSFEASRCDKW